MFQRAATAYALQVPLEALHNGVLWSALHVSTGQRCTVRVLDKEAPRIEVVSCLGALVRVPSGTAWLLTMSPLPSGFATGVVAHARGALFGRTHLH